MANKLFIFGFICLISASVYAQEKSISITIDDVPNTTKYQKDNFSPVFLDVLDSLQVPFTIFINEDKIYKSGLLDKNKDLLERWIENNQVTIGNHTYSHSRHSDVGFESFVKDIEQGEILTKKYVYEHNKEFKYFRFPFNDMGKDSTQHFQMSAYLKSKNYTVAPFTVESSDWMFDAVYRYFLENGELERAGDIGKLYVNKTIELVKFYEAMNDTIYNRTISHIYLCHDNYINSDYLSEIIKRLKEENYEIVSFEESLRDPIYKQEDIYYQKWGISWLYRWMKNEKERYVWMKQEPDLLEIEKIYNEISKK